MQSRWMQEQQNLKVGDVMELQLIYGGQATLEDMYRLNKLGFEFVVEDGEVSNVLY